MIEKGGLLMRVVKRVVTKEEMEKREEKRWVSMVTLCCEMME